MPDPARNAEQTDAEHNRSGWLWHDHRARDGVERPRELS
jgi:hypothetical protein